MTGFHDSLADLIGVHIIFAVFAAAVLVFPLGLSVNILLLIVVVFYNLLIPLVARWREHPDWFEIWEFVVILSLLQIFPDWFLAEGLNALNFIDQSPPMVGSVPLYMGGLWAIPLFVVIYVSSKITQERGRLQGYSVAAILSLVIFGIAEATMWTLSSWETLAKVTVGHVGLYILVPEMILGMTALLAYDSVKGKGLLYTLVASYLVMTLYIGNASLFYLIIEVLLV
jgi:hypothetical protein